VEPSRRAFLRSGVVALTAGLAGCPGSSQTSPDTQRSQTPTDTSTETPASTSPADSDQGLETIFDRILGEGAANALVDGMNEADSWGRGYAGADTAEELAADVTREMAADPATDDPFTVAQGVHETLFRGRESDDNWLRLEFARGQILGSLDLEVLTAYTLRWIGTEFEAFPGYGVGDGQSLYDVHFRIDTTDHFGGIHFDATTRAILSHDVSEVGDTDGVFSETVYALDNSSFTDWIDAGSVRAWLDSWTGCEGARHWVADYVGLFSENVLLGLGAWTDVEVVPVDSGARDVENAFARSMAESLDLKKRINRATLRTDAAFLEVQKRDGEFEIRETDRLRAEAVARGLCDGAGS